MNHLNTIFLLFTLSLLACHPFKSREDIYSSVHSPSGLNNISYQQVMQRLITVETQYPRARIFRYGKSLSGAHDLMGIKIGNDLPAAAAKRPTVLIMEGMHGDEYYNIADRLPESFLAAKDETYFSKFIDLGGLVYIIPIFNPDGFTAHRRENANNQDLNRDFDVDEANLDLFKQHETKLFDKFLSEEVQKQNLELKLGFSYHCCIAKEDPNFQRDGGIIIPWGFNWQYPLAPQALARHEQFVMKIQDVFGYPYGNGMQIAHYDARGTEGDYFFSRYKSPSIIFEGVGAGEQAQLDKHLTMWQRIFSLLGNEISPNFNIYLTDQLLTGSLSMLVHAMNAAVTELSLVNPDGKQRQPFIRQSQANGHNIFLGENVNTFLSFSRLNLEGKNANGKLIEVREFKLAK